VSDVNVLEFCDVHRAYRRGHPVLDGVSFALEPGEVVGLLGVNGAGKTTLMHMAMGMLEAQRGSVGVFGLDPRERPLEVKRRVGFVSEDQVLPSHLRAQDVLALYRSLFPTWDDDFAGELVAGFGIPGSARVRSLSKGEARKLALACAMAHRPELLLLDEPAGGLDPAARREFLEAAIAYLAETGSTILFSSHHMTDVERIARRVVMIHEGTRLLDEDVDSLRESTCVAFIPGDRLRADDLTAMEECLAARSRPESVHGVFRGEPRRIATTISERFGANGVRCERMPLEELFIELVGESR
jgi:ABC-2 type transport system ATP-binding protein